MYLDMAHVDQTRARYLPDLPPGTVSQLGLPLREVSILTFHNSFIADPLTPTQLKHLHAQERADSVISAAVIPDTDHMLANGEYLAMDILASLLILRHFDILSSGSDFSGHRFNWLAICTDMHFSLLTANGPLRPVFRPHVDTFITLVHGIAFGVQLNNCGHVMPMEDLLAFQAWIARLVNKVGKRRVRRLVKEMDRGGLFVQSLRARVLVPMAYHEQPHMTTAGVLHMMEVVKKEPGKLQRIATRLSPRRLARRMSKST